MHQDRVASAREATRGSDVVDAERTLKLLLEAGFENKLVKIPWLGNKQLRLAFG